VGISVQLDDLLGLAQQDKMNRRDNVDNDNDDHGNAAPETKHKFLATANAMVSYQNIETELSKMQRTHDVAAVQIKAEEQNLEKLILKLERLEHSEIISVEEMKLLNAGIVKENADGNTSNITQQDSLKNAAAMAAASLMVGGTTPPPGLKKSASQRAKSIVSRNRSLFVDTNLANKHNNDNQASALLAATAEDESSPDDTNGLMELGSPDSSPKLPTPTSNGGKKKAKMRAKSMLSSGDGQMIGFRKLAEQAKDKANNMNSPKNALSPKGGGKSRGRSMVAIRQQKNEDLKQVSERRGGKGYLSDAEPTRSEATSDAHCYAEEPTRSEATSNEQDSRC